MHLLGRPFEQLADYRKSTGTAMFLEIHRKPNWVIGSNPKKQYRLQQERHVAHASRIQELEPGMVTAP
jgi:hypothetical protein